MTMTDRSAQRASKITSFRRTNVHETERFDHARYGTNPNSHIDQASSFHSLTKTDQNFWKQLENYRNKHLKWIEEKKSLHGKLKKLQRENDALTKKVKMLKNQITVDIVNQEGPPDFDVSNIMANSRHQIEMEERNNISHMIEQSKLM